MNVEHYSDFRIATEPELTLLHVNWFYNILNPNKLKMIEIPLTLNQNNILIFHIISTSQLLQVQVQLF